jgi:ribosome-binding factor A
LRRTPEVIFEEDRSFERGTKVLSLLNQLSRERDSKEIDEPEIESALVNNAADQDIPS